VLHEIKSSCAQLVAISPQLPDQSLTMVEKNSLKFDVLSDIGNHVARDFGLVFTLPEELRPVYAQFGIDLPAANGDNSFELPVPASYVINRDGIIMLDFVEVDHSKRLEPSDIIAALKKIAA
jgi:peroxiredoxin